MKDQPRIEHQELIDERNAFERDEAEASREFGVEFGENPEAAEAVLAERMGRAR